MHDLAELTLFLPGEIDWTGAAIPALEMTGWCAFRLKSAQRADAVAETLGLPTMGCAASGAIAIGAGDWLMIAPETERETLAARLAETKHCYAADVSDALIMLDMGDTSTLIGRLTGLAPARFGPGKAARTKFAGVPAIFTSTEKEEGVRVIFDISHARHIRAYLDVAA